MGAGAYAFAKGNKTRWTLPCRVGDFQCFNCILVHGKFWSYQKNVLCSIAPLFGNLIEMSLTAFALSLQFNQMKEDQFQKEIATKESDSLRTLVQVVCHDIANPLSVISGSHKVVSRHKGNIEKQEKAWERVGRASSSIEAIINQVKRMQAVKVGKAEIKLSPVSLGKAFQEVDFNLQERAKAKEFS